MTISRRTAIAQGGALAFTGAFASTFSGKLFAQAAASLEQVKVVTGFAPGGVSDTVARAVAAKLSPGYTKLAVVENRTGAGGQIAIQYMKTAPADGTVVLHTSMSMLGIYPYTYKSLPYDPATDVIAASQASLISFGMAVGPAVPASVTTAQEFFVWCKANPGKASFGTPAAGSAPHMAGVVMGRQAGVEMTHVPFRGSQPAILDMLGGQIPAVICPIGEFTQHVPTGRCRVIGSSGAKRSRFQPTVQTFTEQGFKDMEFSETDGFYLPAKTPREIVMRLNAAVRAAMAQPDVIERLAGVGLEAQSSAPEEYSALLKTYSAQWAVRVKAVGFTAES